MFLSGDILERVDLDSCGICCYWVCSDMCFLIYKPFNFFIWPRPEDICRCFSTKLGSGKFWAESWLFDCYALLKSLAFISLLPMMLVPATWVAYPGGPFSYGLLALSSLFDDSILRFSYWSSLLSTEFDCLFRFYYSILPMLLLASMWPLTILMLLRDFSNWRFWASCSI